MKGKLIIICAPSGSGKTTIVRHLLGRDLNLAFSVSATSRKPRGDEKNGVDYYFFSPEVFKEKIDNNEFLEWEEVYENQYYGTLKTEVERLRNSGKNVLFDIDVVGGVNLKKNYGDEALSIFVKAPSIEIIRERLEQRATDSQSELEKRIDKAEKELEYAGRFDQILINDDLESAFRKSEQMVRSFLETRK